METTVLDYDPKEDHTHISSDKIEDNQACSYNGCELLGIYLDIADDETDPDALLKGIKDRKIRILDIEEEILMLREKIELLEALNNQRTEIRKKLITETNDRWLRRQTIT